MEAVAIRMNISLRFVFAFLFFVGAFYTDAFAMHIADGILPAGWCAFWWVVVLPFIVAGISKIKNESKKDKTFKPFIGLIGAAAFIISCLPVPVPFAGVTSHPVGVGIAAIILGPLIAVVIASVTLTLQALFLAHGGLGTLGADIFSMGVVGGFLGYGIFVAVRRLGFSWVTAAFLAGLLSDWGTYASTSALLTLALHEVDSLLPMFASLVIAFSPTQIPLGIMEGFISAFAIRFIKNRMPEFSLGAMKGKL